jgi:hypothetical protein
MTVLQAVLKSDSQVATVVQVGVSALISRRDKQKASYKLYMHQQQCQQRQQQQRLDRTLVEQ